MKLTYLGHACFLLESKDGSAVFDPYAPNYIDGLTLPELCADTVLCSHGHGDHNYSAAVTLTGRVPSFKLSYIDSFHDECLGRKRGKNLITVIDAEGLRIVHCGDLGHKLGDAELSALGRVDVLMIPVGGVYTVDAAAAKEIAEQISPRIVIPMHYRIGNRGLQNVAEVGEFIRLFDSAQVEYLADSTLTVDDSMHGIKVLAVK